MSIKMSQTIQEERFRVIKPILDRETSIKDSAKMSPYSERSIKRWLSNYRKYGMKGLIPKSTEPKTQPAETPIWIKERVVEVRKRTRKCALKIHWQLEKEGIVVHERTVGKILKKEDLVRKYRVKKIKYKYIKAERQPGELMEIDIKYVPGRIANKRYYQYTAIDVASRWRYLRVFEEQSSYHSILFLEDVMKRFKHKIESIKTDNGAVFTNRYLGSYRRSDLSSRQLHSLDKFCAKHNIIHYLIDPGKPAQNGTVERSHRSDQESFYDRNKFKSITDLKKKIIVWNDYYNNLEHCGLDGKTPNEMLKLFKLKVPNVCA
ncbi:transposase [bacterium]|jgi:transposase|nr:transposase [bacterium]